MLLGTCIFGGKNIFDVRLCGCRDSGTWASCCWKSNGQLRIRLLDESLRERGGEPLSIPNHIFTFFLALLFHSFSRFFPNFIATLSYFSLPVSIVRNLPTSPVGIPPSMSD